MSRLPPLARLAITKSLFTISTSASGVISAAVTTPSLLAFKYRVLSSST